MSDCKHGLDEATCYTCRNRVVPRRDRDVDGRTQEDLGRATRRRPRGWQARQQRPGVTVAIYDGNCKACDEPIQADIDMIRYSEEWDAFVHDSHYDDGIPTVGL